MGATLVGEDAGERAGSSVAISGDGTTVVIGSPFNDDGGTDRGEVRVYTWNSGTSTWDRTGTADLQGEADQDRLGYSPGTTMGPVQPLGTRVSTPGTPEPANGTSADQILMAKRPVIVLAQRYR